MLEKNIGKIGKIIITKEVQRVIDLLHNRVGNTEWSGILFYTLTKGNIDNLKNLEFTAQYLYPMDIGSHAYTEQDLTKVPELIEDNVKVYDVFPEALEMSRGMIHTHHTMAKLFV